MQLSPSWKGETMMITNSELTVMSQQNIEAINRNELVELSAIHIRQDLPHEEKILDFLEQIKNPYCFLCGGVPVKVCFTDNGPKLGEILENYFIRIKQG